MPRSQRSKRLRYSPPDAGIYGLAILRVLQRSPELNWPPSHLVDAAGLSEMVGRYALQNLLRLRLIERRSADTVIRVGLTPAGRRYVPPPR